ncbi:MAG: cation transporter, partial [Natronospirillum sp.]
MQRIEIGVEGMSCASCVGRIEKALAGQHGVAAAQVNLTTGKATVEFDQPATPATLVEAIRDAGYEPRQQDANTQAEEQDKAGIDLRRKVIFAAALTIPVVLIAMGK